MDRCLLESVEISEVHTAPKGQAGLSLVKLSGKRQGTLVTLDGVAMRPFLFSMRLEETGWRERGKARLKSNLQIAHKE